jgi:hypothetical protein
VYTAAVFRCRFFCSICCVWLAVFFPFSVYALDTGAATGRIEEFPGVPEETPLRGIVPIPILGYTPEMGGMFGVSLYLYSTPRPFTSPDVTHSVSTNALFTTTGAYSTALFGNTYTPDGGVKFETGVVLQGVPQSFYGVGADSGDLEEGFLGTAVRLEGAALFDAGRHIRVGPSYEFGRYWVDRKKSGGVMDSGDPAGSDGAAVSEAGVLAVRDTRPGLLDPPNGTYIGVSAAVSREPLGAEYDYVRYRVDLRRILPIHRGHRIVVRGLFETVTDEAPFQVLPALGGETRLRGLPGGYYTDRTLIAFQSEYRIPLPGRFGMVVFGEAGQTAEVLSGITTDGFIVTGGGGLRYELDSNQRFNIRLDFGFSREGGLGVYFGVMEAF